MISPTVFVYHLNGNGNIHRIDAFMDTANVARILSMSSTGDSIASDPAAADISLARSKGRLTAPGVAGELPELE
jgi:hypothetical protein